MSNKDLNKSMILITGCAGLFGTHFSRYLISKGYKVIGVDNLSGGYYDYLPSGKNFKFVYGDITDSKFINYVFQHYNINEVYHFAAYAAEGLSPFIRVFNYQNNVIASANIINNCIIHNAKIVFTSTTGRYGNQNIPYVETQIPQPIDPYGIAKYAIEMDLKCANKQFGLEYAIAIPHNVVGIYQNIWDRYRNVISIFILRAINDRPLLIYGDGTQTRAYSDIQYYMKPLLYMMNTNYNDNDNRLYNLGSDKFYSIIDIAHMIQFFFKNLYDKKVNIQHRENRYEVKHSRCNHDKAKSELKFVDKTNLYNLVENMITWAVKQPIRNIKNMDYEIDKNLYSYWK